MTTIDEARHFAEAAHEGQWRKGAAREPYAVHLAEVAALTARFGGSTRAVMAAWLHDTVEDCGVDPAELALRFGDRVAALVEELTDDTTLPREARKAAQLARAPGKSPDAALVKLCDKLSNVRAVGLSPPVDWSAARKRAYLDWSASVVAALPALPEAARRAFAEALEESRARLAAEVR